MHASIRKHLHFFLVTTVLVLVMTFPSIVYVFKTDVFWLPAKHCCDVFIEFWDIWYAKHILAGQADLFYTNTIFYPEGVSLTYNQVGMLYSTVVIALQQFLPPPNAFTLAYLFIIFSSASAAYVYLHWLIKDRWLALFGAVVFGLSPFILKLTNWPQQAWLAPVPLVLYGVHRGIAERRSYLIIIGGIIAGLTSEFTTLHLCVHSINISHIRLRLGGSTLARPRILEARHPSADSTDAGLGVARCPNAA